MDRIQLFRLPLNPFPNSAQFLDLLSDALEHRRALTISFVNPHAWHHYKHDSQYQQQLRDLDIVLPDGIGVVKALQWVQNRKVERMSFLTLLRARSCASMSTPASA